VRSLVALVALAAPALAWADDAEAPVSTDHRRQFGFSGRLAFRMRGIATYEDTDYCGERSTESDTGNAAVCLGRDLETSYGVGKGKELILEFRLGLERDFGRVPVVRGPRQLFLSPGMRFFFSQGKNVQLFTTIQGVLDFTGYDKPTGEGRGVDYGLRNLSGVWFDVHDAYGFYFFVGETVTFSRWLLGELELGVGFQGRYP
jgi:hypothetical protein